MKIKFHVIIRIAHEPPKELELEFSKAEILIGRNQDCDLKIPIEQVSRQHAKIYLVGSSWKIQDLNTSLGTKVNGQIIKDACSLKAGDKISIGSATIQVSFLGMTGGLVASEEKTSVVAQKMVQDIFGNHDNEVNQPYFRVMNGEEEGAKVSLSRDSQELVIGRDPTCDLRLTDKSVSRKHAQLIKNWNVYSIDNLGSKNGLIVNGRSVIAPIQLTDSDEVFVGDIHLVFHEPIAEAIGALDSVPHFEATQSEPTTTEEIDYTTREKVAPEQIKRQKERVKKSIPNVFGIFEVLLTVFAAIVVAGLLYGISKYLENITF